MGGQQIYGHKIEKKIPILLYRTHTDMESSNLVGGFMPEGVGAFVESERKRMVLKADFSRPLSRAIGVHELAHEFQIDIQNHNIVNRMINMNKQRPLWFYEGGAEFIAGLYDPHTRDDIRRRSQRVVSSDKHTVPTWEALKEGSANPYEMGAMMFEFLEEGFGIGVALQIQGLKQKNIELGELIYDLAKGKLGNPDENSEKFNQQVIQFWTKKYQFEAIERPKPYDENENISSHSVTPQGHQYPMLSPILSPDGAKIAAFTVHNYSVSLAVFEIPKEDVYISKEKRAEEKIQQAKGEKKKEKSKKLRNLTPHLPPIPWEYLVVQGLETWPFNGFDASWSPDGSMIAVFARINRDHALVLLDAENGKVKEKIELPLDQAFSPSFSPDGKKVYFSAAKNITRDIYVVYLDTKEIVNLTKDERYDTAPAVSPDGAKVAYVGSDGDFQHLFLLHLPEGRTEQLTYGKFNDSS
ncbi:MAG: hypothetical protein Q8Q87_01725, partial [Candidatus Omnitrophota bacterium]|nr:hypothetical protein [Candidatus Omnitrophota bacterium]